MNGVAGKPVMQPVGEELKYEGEQLMYWQQMVVLIAQDMRKRFKLAVLVAVLVN